MKCLETRRRNGMKWRRYRDEEGATHETYEVPATVARRFGMKRLQEEVERAQRRKSSRTRQARVLRLLAEGWKALAVAHEVGLSHSQVYRISYAGKPGAKTAGAKAPK